jgi:hypothetical protein
MIIFLYKKYDERIEMSSEDTTLNSVTNQLLLKYDSNFNKLYKTSDQLNQGITNKEEIIIQNLQSEESKDKIIDSLYSLIPFSMMIGILWIVYGMGKLPIKSAFSISIVLLIIYIFYIYVYVYHYAGKNALIQSSNTGSTMKSWFESIFVGQGSNYTCPADCINEISGEISGSTDPTNPDNNTVVPYPTVILDKQSSENVWLHGDRSLNLYNAKFIKPSYLQNGDYYSQEELNTIQPQPWFRKISPNGATYYKCQYDGAFPRASVKARNAYRGNGIPMLGKEEVFSTIPCDQMSGYKEKGRFICHSNEELNRLNPEKCVMVGSQIDRDELKDLMANEFSGVEINLA